MGSLFTHKTVHASLFLDPFAPLLISYFKCSQQPTLLLLSLLAFFPNLATAALYDVAVEYVVADENSPCTAAEQSHLRNIAKVCSKKWVSQGVGNSPHWQSLHEYNRRDLSEEEEKVAALADIQNERELPSICECSILCKVGALYWCECCPCCGEERRLLRADSERES